MNKKEREYHRKAVEGKLSKKEKENFHTHNKLLKRLYLQQEGLCYYCQRKCYKMDEGWQGAQKDNTATVEHLHPRNDIRRYLTGDEGYTVMACFECNQRANEEFWAGMLKDYEGLEEITLIRFIHWRRRMWYKMRRTIKIIFSR